MDGNNISVFQFITKFTISNTVIKVVRNEIGKNYEAESTPKIELLLRRVECPIAESVFVSLNHNSLNRIKTRAAESILDIFILIQRIEFRFLGLCLYQRFSFQRIGNFLSSCLSGLAFSNFCRVFALFFVANYHFKNKTSLVSQFQSQLDYFVDEVS